ncbi:MAG TPA: hypothetical protein VLC97_16845 [Rhodanobacteraceae bacterium]|nr:hypothetical protein [Rhodanobacteraceae bacterium]
MIAILRHTSAALLLFAASNALAYNVLKNGDFAAGANGWNLSGSGGGFAGTESFFGSPAGGSLRLQSYTFNATAHADQCVDIHKWFALDFSLRQFNDGESGSGTHPFKLDVYDAADCGGNVLSTITLPNAGDAVGGNPATGWVEVSVLGTPLPAGAVSAKVSLDTIAGASGVSYYLLDDVQVVPPDEIFPDGFEAN